MSDQIIVLSDRIKELSHSIGTGSLRLDGAATGFSAFGDFYASGDALYYAVTDGTDYEVGSGQYMPDGSSNSLVRFPFRSTNSDNAVNFAAGVKEVYVTYPGQYAVFTASGLGPFKEPKPSGLAFWGSSQILCHDDTDQVFLPVHPVVGRRSAGPAPFIHPGRVDCTAQIGHHPTEQVPAIAGLWKRTHSDRHEVRLKPVVPGEFQYFARDQRFALAAVA